MVTEVKGRESWKPRVVESCSPKPRIERIVSGIGVSREEGGEGENEPVRTTPILK
jgi:hypothetical protein